MNGKGLEYTGDYMEVERRGATDEISKLIFDVMNNYHLRREDFALALDPNTYHELRLVAMESCIVYDKETKMC